MEDRRQQWIRFYEMALTGTADPRVGPDEILNAERAACWVAEQAERVADAAMSRLDARDFPPTKVDALLAAARQVWEQAEHGAKQGAFVRDHLLATLGKALADLRGEGR